MADIRRNGAFSGEKMKLQRHGGRKESDEGLFEDLIADIQTIQRRQRQEFLQTVNQTLGKFGTQTLGTLPKASPCCCMDRGGTSMQQSTKMVNQVENAQSSEFPSRRKSCCCCSYNDYPQCGAGMHARQQSSSSSTCNQADAPQHGQAAGVCHITGSNVKSVHDSSDDENEDDEQRIQHVAGKRPVWARTRWPSSESLALETSPEEHKLAWNNSKFPDSSSLNVEMNEYGEQTLDAPLFGEGFDSGETFSGLEEPVISSEDTQIHYSHTREQEHRRNFSQPHLTDTGVEHLSPPYGQDYFTGFREGAQFAQNANVYYGAQGATAATSATNGMAKGSLPTSKKKQVSQFHHMDSNHPRNQAINPGVGGIPTPYEQHLPDTHFAQKVNVDYREQGNATSITFCSAEGTLTSSQMTNKTTRQSPHLAMEEVTYPDVERAPTLSREQFVGVRPDAQDVNVCCGVTGIPFSSTDGAPHRSQPITVHEQVSSQSQHLGVDEHSANGISTASRCQIRPQVLKSREVNVSISPEASPCVYSGQTSCSNDERFFHSTTRTSEDDRGGYSKTLSISAAGGTTGSGTLTPFTHSALQSQQRNEAVYTVSTSSSEEEMRFPRFELGEVFCEWGRYSQKRCAEKRIARRIEGKLSMNGMKKVWKVWRYRLNVERRGANLESEMAKRRRKKIFLLWSKFTGVSLSTHRVLDFFHEDIAKKCFVFLAEHTQRRNHLKRIRATVETRRKNEERQTIYERWRNCYLSAIKLKRAATVLHLGRKSILFHQWKENSQIRSERKLHLLTVREHIDRYRKNRIWACWYRLFYIKKEKHSTLTQILLGVSRTFCLRVCFHRWCSFATNRRSSLNALYTRLQLFKVCREFMEWKTTTAQRLRFKQLINGHACRVAIHTWVKLCRRNVVERNALHKMAIKKTKRCVLTSFLKLKKSYLSAIKREQTCSKAILAIAFVLKKDTLQAWKTFTSKRRQLAVAFEDLRHTHDSRLVSRSFRNWRFCFQHRKISQAQWEIAIIYHRKAMLKRCLSVWNQNVKISKTEQIERARYAHEWSQHVLYACWSSWSAFAGEQKLKKRAAKLTLKRAQQKIIGYRCLQAWHRCVVVKRTYREYFRKATRRMQRSRLHRTVRHWRVWRLESLKRRSNEYRSWVFRRMLRMSKTFEAWKTYLNEKHELVRSLVEAGKFRKQKLLHNHFECWKACNKRNKLLRSGATKLRAVSQQVVLREAFYGLKVYSQHKRWLSDVFQTISDNRQGYIRQSCWSIWRGASLRHKLLEYQLDRFVEYTNQKRMFTVIAQWRKCTYQMKLQKYALERIYAIIARRGQSIYWYRWTEFVIEERIRLRKQQLADSVCERNLRRKSFHVWAMKCQEVKMTRYKTKVVQSLIIRHMYEYGIRGFQHNVVRRQREKRMSCAAMRHSQLKALQRGVSAWREFYSTKRQVAAKVNKCAAISVRKRLLRALRNWKKNALKLSGRKSKHAAAIGHRNSKLCRWSFRAWHRRISHNARVERASDLAQKKIGGLKLCLAVHTWKRYAKIKRLLHRKESLCKSRMETYRRFDVFRTLRMHARLAVIARSLAIGHTRRLSITILKSWNDHTKNMKWLSHRKALMISNRKYTTRKKLFYVWWQLYDRLQIVKSRMIGLLWLKQDRRRKKNIMRSLKMFTYEQKLNRYCVSAYSYRLLRNLFHSWKLAAERQRDLAKREEDFEERLRKFRLHNILSHWHSTSLARYTQREILYRADSYFRYKAQVKSLKRWRTQTYRWQRRSLLETQARHFLLSTTFLKLHQRTVTLKERQRQHELCLQPVFWRTTERHLSSYLFGWNRFDVIRKFVVAISAPLLNTDSQFAREAVGKDSLVTFHSNVFLQRRIRTKLSKAQKALLFVKKSSYWNHWVSSANTMAYINHCKQRAETYWRSLTLHKGMQAWLKLWKAQSFCKRKILGNTFASLKQSYIKALQREQRKLLLVNTVNKRMKARIFSSWVLSVQDSSTSDEQCIKSIRLRKKRLILSHWRYLFGKSLQSRLRCKRARHLPAVRSPPPRNAFSSYDEKQVLQKELSLLRKTRSSELEWTKNEQFNEAHALRVRSESNTQIEFRPRKLQEIVCGILNGSDSSNSL